MIVLCRARQTSIILLHCFLYSDQGTNILFLAMDPLNIWVHIKDFFQLSIISYSQIYFGREKSTRIIFNYTYNLYFYINFNIRVYILSEILLNFIYIYLLI